ncbi:MAG: hypothetical protein ACLFV4_05625 [Candidatus Hydrogenedentota bacterium]
MMNVLPWLESLTVAAQEGTRDTPEMTAGSWIYLIVVWALIIALNAFCYKRIFTKKE